MLLMVFSADFINSQWPSPVMLPARLVFAFCRAICEARALKFGRRMLLERFTDIKNVVREAEIQRQDKQSPYFELK